MEFDKTKLYSILNADKVKVGSKGYFSDNLVELKFDIEFGSISVSTLQSIETNNEFPFTTNSCKSQFFYLVEEPKEKKYRPYKNCDEFIADFKKRWRKYSGVKFHENAMSLPFIWLKEKCSDDKFLITGIDSTDIIAINNLQYSLTGLLDYFTYLDGSPCGILEE